MFKKNVLLIGFALFSLFFGAGNLILPPMLGFKGGVDWFVLLLGFLLSAVFIPLLGIRAHAKLQGTLFDFAKKVSLNFSLIYAIIIYIISVALPSPRTASVTHEMAIAPFFASSSWLTSGIFFILVLIFVLNRSKILDLIGKFLTPAIFLILLAIIGIAVFSFEFTFQPSTLENALATGILEGYQTFDAIGAVVVGGVIIVSINLKHTNETFEAKRELIAKGGLWAAIALLLVYGGLIYTGALFQNSFDTDITRSNLLNAISLDTLGDKATIFLSILVSLACFTTAVGIVTGASDFAKSRLNNSQKAYTITATISCILGVLIGQFNVGYIIAIALPVLMLIYPITIVLIILNNLPEHLATKSVFKWVILVTVLFSIPDFLHYAFGPLDIGLNTVRNMLNFMPFNEYHMAWLLPALVTFLSLILFQAQEKHK